jgi:hypothetical protein
MKLLNAAAAAILAFAAGAAPALAQDLELAKKAVKTATDEQLLAEFQRRFDARTRGPGRTRSMTVTRGAASPLSSVDEADLLQATRYSTRTIYGPTDERKDFYLIGDESVKSLARSSVALFESGVLQPSAGNLSLKTKLLKDVQKLCAGEKFATQPSGAFCSGTLVSPDTVLTAGHCVREISNDESISPLPDVRFVFGYWMQDAASAPAAIPSAQVFAGKDVLGGEKNDARDWALVRLDRAVPDTIAKPVTDWTVDPVKKGQRVFVIGYPSGIPLKFAPGAHVRDDSNPGFFVADLDTFGGNSGSGVYDQATKKLAGVLVRGDTDYLQDKANKCWRVHVCPQNGCRGEDVTRISVVQAPK